MGNNGHHINNSSDFVDRIRQVTVSEDDTLVSYDVSALFTSVPILEAVNIIKEKLKGDTTLKQRTDMSVDDLSDLLQFVLDSTYFTFRDQFYQQRHGSAMGSPVLRSKFIYGTF